MTTNVVDNFEKTANFEENFASRVGDILAGIQEQESEGTTHVKVADIVKKSKSKEQPYYKNKNVNEEYSSVSEVPYLRVGIKYFKKIHIPILRSGDLQEKLVEWNKGTIKEDEGDILSIIPKYDDFCIVPSHVDYREKIGNCYNRYKPLSHKPKAGNCNTILNFLKHIAGEQYPQMIEYCKLLYLKPEVRLPILCLVSQEKGTGKSTFVNLLKRIYGYNMTLNRSEDFYSQFNDDWTDKLIVAVEETFFDKREISEKIKNISTAETYKTEGKNVKRGEVDLFVKVILCSNQEESFIKIDADDNGRFWVIKVNPFENENYNPSLLDEMTKEIPHFLQFLIDTPYLNPKALTRFWFTPQQTDTEALYKIMQVSDYKAMVLKELLIDKFKEFNVSSLKYTPTDIIEILTKEYQIKTINQKQAGEVFKNWGLKPKQNACAYKTPYWRAANENEYLIDYHGKIGRYYEFERKDYANDFGNETNEENTNCPF